MVGVCPVWPSCTQRSTTSPTGGNRLSRQRATGLAFGVLIENATARYGEGRLPLFLAALAQRVTWNDLIPGIFDLSVEEFEAGWRVWLGEEYGL